MDNSLFLHVWHDPIFTVAPRVSNFIVAQRRLQLFAVRRVNGPRRLENGELDERVSSFFFLFFEWYLFFRGVGVIEGTIDRGTSRRCFVKRCRRYRRYSFLLFIRIASLPFNKDVYTLFFQRSYSSKLQRRNIFAWRYYKIAIALPCRCYRTRWPHLFRTSRRKILKLLWTFGAQNIPYRSIGKERSAKVLHFLGKDWKARSERGRSYPGDSKWNLQLWRRSNYFQTPFELTYK